ncbi:MAG: PEP-CTERM sorting domain-containing protein [Aquincola tertiaricarbonis]
MNQRHFRLCGLAAAALLAVSAAHADDLSVNRAYYTPDGKLAGGLAISPAGTEGPGLFESQNLTTGTSFLAYCVEQSQGATSAVHSYVASAFSGPAEVQELYDRFFDTSILTQAGAVAFQLALWELTGGTEVADFTFVSVAGAKTTALDWLITVRADNDPFAQKYTLTQWSNATYQDVLQATPVPEPETYALMLAGLGAVGLMARRRGTQAR